MTTGRVLTYAFVITASADRKVMLPKIMGILKRKENSAADLLLTPISFREQIVAPLLLGPKIKAMPCIAPVISVRGFSLSQGYVFP